MKFVSILMQQHNIHVNKYTLQPFDNDTKCEQND